MASRDRYKDLSKAWGSLEKKQDSRRKKHKLKQLTKEETDWRSPTKAELEAHEGPWPLLAVMDVQGGTVFMRGTPPADKENEHTRLFDAAVKRVFARHGETLRKLAAGDVVPNNTDNPLVATTLPTTKSPKKR